MKIYHRGRYVKNVPAKYAKIPDLPDYFEEIDSPRMSVDEYWILELALFARKIQSFLSVFEEKSPVDYWLIAKSSPKMAHEVTMKDGNIYYSLLFRNGFAIRINRKIYKMCPIQRKASCDSPLVAIPPYEQLTLAFS
jgi:hypothetical protein